MSTEAPETRRAWTRAEQARLYLLAETRLTEDIARVLGRSRDSVRLRMAALGIRARQGTYGLWEAAQRAGYAPKVFRRAADALWPPTAAESIGAPVRYRDARGRLWMRFTEGHIEAVVRYLATQPRAPRSEYARARSAEATARMHQANPVRAAFSPGQRVGRWTVIGYVTWKGPRRWHGGWECRCDCGAVRRVPQHTLAHRGDRLRGCRACALRQSPSSAPSDAQRC